MSDNLYKRIRAKLSKRYRVELIDEVTLYQSRQFNVKPLTVVYLGVLLFFLIVGGTAAIFVFTPALHRLIPGYINPSEFAEEKKDLLRQLEQVEQEVQRWEAYGEIFKNLAGIDSSDIQLDPGRMDSIQQRIYAEQNNVPPDASPVPAVEIPDPTDRPTPEKTNTGTVRTVMGEKQSPVLVQVANRDVLRHLFPPLKGTVNNGFRWEGGHYGVDIVAAANTLIRAAADGYIILAEYSEDNGWVIGLASADEVVTFYKHNSRLLKEVGTYVRAGEAIAIIGNTGENTTGMHLHFELWHRGYPLDPTNYVSFNP
ncbi:MAG: M23 family metallopeptidase [Bacteroidia bacterium]